jgi:squalene-associated FAD-dependent desaturase
MGSGRVHIVGAGLAGLSAAVALHSRAEIVLHEASRAAGGRCRSYHDAGLGMTIDNGNHLILSGNKDTLAFAKAIGGEGLEGQRNAEFCFVDLVSGERWAIRPNAGPMPWWVFDPRRRAPGTRARDYFAMARLARAGNGARLADCVPCSGAFYEKFLRPVLVAALNTDPATAAAVLARAVAGESLARGAKACRPIVARFGLSRAFADPAIRLLDKSDATLRFDHRLRRLILSETRVAALDFGDELILLGPKDQIILATPSAVASALLPDLRTPTQHNAIVNAHFIATAPESFPPLLGVLNATTEWIFTFPDRISVTVSDANRLLEKPREALAAKIWAEVSALTGLPAALPPWQIVKEKRATFAATPAENAKRPAMRTRWTNLLLAGDWTATGLPATIEGAIRSGNKAASAAMRAVH